MRRQFILEPYGRRFWRKRVIEIAVDNIRLGFMKLYEKICIMLRTTEYINEFKNKLRMSDILIKNLYSGEDFYLLYQVNLGDYLIEINIPAHYQHILNDCNPPMTNEQMQKLGATIEVHGPNNKNRWPWVHN